MKYDKKTGNLILASGKEIYSVLGFLSISEAADYDIAAYGFDGYVDEELSKEERREIAEYEIALWQKWGEL